MFKPKPISKILQLMDQDYSYSEAVKEVVSQTGLPKQRLEKILNRYI